MTPGAPRYAVPADIDIALLGDTGRGTAVIDLSGATMGTTWRVRLAAPAGADLDALSRNIDARLGQISNQMSHWSPSSTLSRFNHSAAGSWTRIASDFAAVVTGGMEVAKQSGGAFDPSLGRVTDLWGLGPIPRAARPSPDDLAAALAASGWRRLALAEATWLGQPGGLWLDLSGIAKGHAVDAVADLLAASGVRHTLVEIGGECAGRGMRPDGDPWWVELEAPPHPELAPLRVALHALAVATSGDYVRGPHTIDPRTGNLAPHPPAAVSVLHRSCMIADAWATALTVLDRDAARTLATDRALAVRVVERDGEEWISDALAAMIGPGE